MEGIIEQLEEVDVNVISANIDDEVESEEVESEEVESEEVVFQYYSCPCLADKNSRIIELLSKFNIDRFCRVSRSMYIMSDYYICETCKNNMLDIYQNLPLESTEIYEIYFSEIQTLIKKDPDAFFTKIPKLNISPHEYLNNLYKYSNEMCDNIYEKTCEHFVCNYLLCYLEKIFEYLKQEVINAKLKRDALAFIKNTTDDVLLKLPMDVWLYIFDFI